MINTTNGNISDVYFRDESIEFVYRGDKLVYRKIFTKKLRPGVIIFYDSVKGIQKAAKPINLTRIDLDRYIPIGICVTPYQSERPLMISLPLMQCNNPTTGSIDKKDGLSNRIDMK